MSTNVPNFGARLVEERDRLELTQGDMQTIAGVNRRTQYNYEQSLRLPDVSYLAALAKHGFDVAYLITGKRLLRYGAVDESLLRNILIATEIAISALPSPVDPAKKATIIALLYQTFAATGEIDQSVIEKLIRLASQG